jgi:hypothetical protein
MKDITILDNFINDEELEEARKFIYTNKVQDWFFHTTDNCDKKFILDVSHGGVELLRRSIVTPSAEKFITKIQNKIEKCINKKLNLWRVYLNRQVCGQDVPFHTDDIKYHAYTLLIYIGDITPENYDKAGGDLEFKNKENTRVEPFTQRAVLFRGCIPHRVYAPLLQGVTRISFAFKFFCMSEKVPFFMKYS